MLIFFKKHESQSIFKRKKHDKKIKNKTKHENSFFEKASDRCVLESDDGHRRNETPL